MARPKKLPEDLQTVRDNARADVETAAVANRALRDTLETALDDVHKLRNMLQDALGDVLGAEGSPGLVDAIGEQTDRLTHGDGTYSFKAVQDRTAQTFKKFSVLRANLNMMLQPVDISPADTPTEQEGEDDDRVPEFLTVERRA